MLEQWSAISNRVLKEQGRFIEECIEYVSKRHKKELLIVAHSMGSVVARLALHERDVPLISLAAPFDQPVLTFDSRDPIDYFIDETRSSRIFVSGGYADVQVLPPTKRNHFPANIELLNTETLPMVWASPDHQAIVWAHPIVEYIGRLIQTIS